MKKDKQIELQKGWKQLQKQQKLWKMLDSHMHYENNDDKKVLYNTSAH